MKLKDIKEKIEKATVAVATVTKDSKPYAIVIMYAKVIDNKIIITDNYMKTTVENIKNNPNVSLVFWQGEEGWRISGTVTYHSSGRWLDYVKSLKENQGFPAKGALIINVEEITKLG